MKWFNAAIIVISTVLMGLIIASAIKERNPCRDAVRAGVAMMATADQAINLFRNDTDPIDAWAVIIESEKFTEDFHRLAKECLK